MKTILMQQVVKCLTCSVLLKVQSDKRAFERASNLDLQGTGNSNSNYMELDTVDVDLEHNRLHPQNYLQLPTHRSQMDRKLSWLLAYGLLS